MPAVEQLKLLARELDAKLYVIPGNHDVGDKPVAWMPAGTVTTEFVNQHEQLRGPLREDTATCRRGAVSSCES